MDSIFIWKEISVKNTIKWKRAQYIYAQKHTSTWMALTRGWHKDSTQEIIKILPLKELESALAEKFKQACENNASIDSIHLKRNGLHIC
jgi:hypothetical protein